MQKSISLSRRAALGAAAGVLVPLSGPAHASMTLPTGAVGDFDFQEGRWHVRHSSRSATGNQWRAFEGECSMRKVLDGQGNIEEHVWQRDGETYRAMGIRTFDPGARHWSIFWIDRRWPATIGAPVVGGFTGARGEFYSEDIVDGRTSIGRFLWLIDDSDHCRWEQASSRDDGASWDTNWRMSFTRLAG